MIQSILFFALGFLSAGFLALIVAPAVWRRAVALTRKRIEASVPLTLTEIQADKDRMRAEFAMSTRRLEISFKTFREKAAAQIVEINRNREELKQLAAERDGMNEALSDWKRRPASCAPNCAGAKTSCRFWPRSSTRRSRRWSSGRSKSTSSAGCTTRRALSSSSRQLELVARESEIEKLSGDMATCAASARRPTGATRKSPPRAGRRARR